MAKAIYTITWTPLARILENVPPDRFEEEARRILDEVREGHRRIQHFRYPLQIGEPTKENPPKERGAFTDDIPEDALRHGKIDPVWSALWFDGNVYMALEVSPLLPPIEAAEPSHAEAIDPLRWIERELKQKPPEETKTDFARRVAPKMEAAVKAGECKKLLSWHTIRNKLCDRDLGLWPEH